jgi:FixJ family two-component response regulator
MNMISPSVYIVDDDASFRTAASRLLGVAGRVDCISYYYRL